MLGKLLQCDLVAQRMRGSARVCGMRYLYTVLHWVSQRREELVRAREAPVPTGRACAGRCRTLLMHWVPAQAAPWHAAVHARTTGRNKSSVLDIQRFLVRPLRCSACVFGQA